MIYGQTHPIKAIVMSKRTFAQKHGILDNVPKVLFVYAMNSIKVLSILSAHLLNSPVAIFLQIHFILHLAGEKLSYSSSQVTKLSYSTLQVTKLS